MLLSYVLKHKIINYKYLFVIFLNVCYNIYNGKIYQYNGTYCEVLNRLGVKAIYKHDYNALVSALEGYKKMNGTTNIFSGIVVDYSREIEEYTNRLNDVNANYVIV